MESSAHNGTAAAHFPGLRPQAPEKPARNDRSFKPRSEYLNVEAVNAPANRIMATTVSVANQHRFGELYVDFLRARKRVFIDHKKWDLPNTDGMEFDQYDTPQSSAVVVHEFGRVLAGVRLLPTTAYCGCYTYMLKDAQRGLLQDIPETVLYQEAPVAPHVIEATRLFITPDVSAERRMLVQTKLMQAMASSANAQGAKFVIGIVPAIFQRWMTRLGFSAVPMGPKLNISGDNTQAAIMNVSSAVSWDQATAV
ncbi:N-acyl-L-homoserine lactone synthetase [Sulfitobacter pseudonitzschiae]|uniref:acyl-homoserine-lactone synthase n=1 Tax=Pseudosulfitobacter pseudonitzschiae TaxID=1402135 RepID=UPI00091B0C8D|nr:acyl-homoserine-lactone synthase [Pseudosulfitobacter pseudonitzschiae]MBM1816141.1 N-acyl-L-homoserine lactone synthetase [Pseudosulfitobacter pseudonitzschiae]MBM1833447.1 N-acyl-L-homoserine lactone synthetase [Pseudosulfitobacter pseudonitzschiae]MBM1838314.1 N-acyl-L-homoserine lactone synthetase [Pseudosulfitobacter pseudonitzschiae]MBM1842846.1 N-acyl-L-homoserine lactone synthetase [Pseudosulfitobacter pseudonitzschiae]MBM1847712.1 N-acyl-L-homoserine lactone synthetase [Pseudosulfi